MKNIFNGTFFTAYTYKFIHTLSTIKLPYMYAFFAEFLKMKI